MPSRRPPAAIQSMFSTPVGRITNPLAENLNAGLKRAILASLGRNPSSIRGKNETTDDLADDPDPVFTAISDWVCVSARRFVETLAGASLDDAMAAKSAAEAEHWNSTDAKETRPQHDIGVARSWASVYDDGDDHEPHIHPNTALTAIYYVSTGGAEYCSVDLDDPRSGVEYHDPGLSIADEGQKMRLNCRPGELVLFPAWVRHGVPKHTEAGRRISMSWNLVYVAKPAP